MSSSLIPWPNVKEHPVAMRAGPLGARCDVSRSPLVHRIRHVKGYGAVAFVDHAVVELHWIRAQDPADERVGAISDGP